MSTKHLSTEISSHRREISRDEFVMLPLTEMAKRKTLGKRLYEARQGLGLTARELSEKIKQEYRQDCGETTVRYIEQDKTANPGIKTIEFIALGVGLDPLEAISMLLEESPETEKGYKESQFARAWEKYKKLNEKERAFIDGYVEMLITKIDSWS